MSKSNLLLFIDPAGIELGKEAIQLCQSNPQLGFDAFQSSQEEEFMGGSHSKAGLTKRFLKPFFLSLTVFPRLRSRLPFAFLVHQLNP